jgi:hypothetical protein
MNKKRQRNFKNNEKNYSDDEEDIDNNKEKDLFNCVFVFSCILPEYFLMIKNLLLPNFISEDISLNGLTDLVICMREDIGTTIKVENDDENKIFGVFTLIPFPFYKENPVVIQMVNMLQNKIVNLNMNNKNNILNAIKNKKIGMLINERFVNLSEELIPPALNFVINEMNECIEISNDKNNKNITNKEKNKYNLDYIIIYSRYVIKENKNDINKNYNTEQMQIEDDEKYINLVIKDNNKNKKPKLDKSNQIVYYKYEIEDFLKKADYSFDYKLTGGIYDSSCIYINQNNNEQQYMKIILIKFQKFYEVIHELNNHNS